uniref:Myxovirus (influenza virus) resistance F n=1 Tax=Cyprinus carpio TaxID=7962 RepID=A0A8C2GWE1_CYPCA
IDSLRLIGIEKDMDLPSIAVVGDQSSGKSSVLEALSGVGLPRGSGIVTRCPLELKLRKFKKGPWSGTISYCGHKETFYDPSMVDNLVRKAQNDLAGNTVGISDELVTLEISSPDVCDLTLIDLPGITRVPVQGQPDDIADQIKNLIQKYISKSETIILVVVPCNVDITTTEALRMAQHADPDGYRTLAILTKPDLIDKGAEIDVLNIVQGRVVPLSKGYIIVRCRGQSDINNKIPLDEAIDMEMEFFRNHRYFSSLLNDNKASTLCLTKKLTKELVDHIKKSLPHLTEQINARILGAREELKKYDQGPPLEEEEMGPFLINAKMTEMIEKYNEMHRGRELLTFSEFIKFEYVIHDHVAALQKPAMQTLKDVQGTVYSFLNVQLKMFRNKYFLNTSENGADVAKLLKEDSEQGRRRADLKKRLERLTQAQELINNRR